VDLARYSKATGMQLNWVEDYRLRVRVLGDADRGYEVVIEGNAAGLHSLGQHLLSLSQPDVPEGFHLHLDQETVLDAPSAELVLDRGNDPGAHEG